MSARNVRIGDILGLRRDQIDVDTAEIYREIGVRSFGNGLFIKDAVSGSDLGSKRVFRIRDGDLVISNVFAWEGAVAVAGHEHDGLIGSHRFMTWTPHDPDEVSVHFLQHFFASDTGLELLRRASPGSAGRNRTLSIKNFEAIQVPLPDIDEQRRIAKMLERVDYASSKARRLTRIAEALLPATRNEVFDAMR